MSDDRLRDAYERLMGERSREPIENPVSLEEMVSVLEKRGTESERLEVMNRVLRHPVYRREFDLLRAAHQAASRPAARTRFVWPMSLAAGILLAVAIGSQLRQPPSAGEEPLRGPPTFPLYDPPEIAVADSARSFLWANVAGAREYAFTLMDLEGRSLYETAVRDTTLVLPDSVRLARGAEYRWRVRARTTSREETSELRPLRVRE